MLAVGKGGWELSHGGKGQMGTLADCLNFSDQFLLDVAQFDRIISLCVFLVFVPSLGPEWVLHSAGGSPWETQACCLRGFPSRFLLGSELMMF